MLMVKRYGPYDGRDLPPAQGCGLGQVASVLDQIAMVRTTEIPRGQHHAKVP